MTDQPDPPDPPVDHPTESEIADAVSGRLDEARSSAVSAHVASCLACRILFDRLNQGLPELPEGDLPGDIAALPDALRTAVSGADRPKAGPQVGELWRARRLDRGPATLVWLRALGPAEAAVVPVSFDTEIADDDTVIVPAAASPLGIPLALHVSVEATIDNRVLLDRLGSIDVAAAVESMRGTTRAITSSELSPLDQRIEHRQALADGLAELAPGRADAADDNDDWWLVDDRSGRADLLVAIHRGLVEMWPGARISPRPASATGSEHLSAVALVAELDAFVLVACIDHPLERRALLESARRALHADQLLNAVCLVEPAAPFLATVIDRRDVVDAIETPSGDLRPPRQSRAPAPIGEALVKFLDAAISPFGRLAATIVDARLIDPRALAVDVAAEAVRAVEASAKGYKVAGKRPGYERVKRHRASITRLVEAALGDPEVDVESILEDGE